MTDFDKCFDFLCKWEGWYSNDSSDFGGETILGISKNYWPEDFEVVKALPDNQKIGYARNFYEVNFWLHFNCDLYEYPLCLIIFDSRVNSGKSFYTDGDEWWDILFKRIKHHNKRVQENATQLKFLRGWINRCLALYEEGKNAISKI